MPYDTITDLDQLILRLQSYNPDAEADFVRRAYEFSAKAHAGQMRQSGEPYLQHPLAVAGLLTALRSDVTAVVAGLLHDTLEDTLATPSELEQLFGKDVVRLVDGVTKIGKIQFRNYEEKQAENFRKMVLSMADDIRVVLIKLADRVHNMRTLEHLHETKRQQIAQETLEIYAPLANRLGIGWIKNELEDLCLKYLKPDAYAMLKLRVAKRDEDRQAYIQEVAEQVKAALAEAGLPCEVHGRPKHLFGIYQKMERQSISFEEVYDLTAIRVITDTKMNCYAVLGLIHSLWRPVPGRFKDYIAIPKSNLYQSLHTTVVGPKGEHVEFQIRTDEMHRTADYGIAPTGNIRSAARSTTRTARSSVGCASSSNGIKIWPITGSSWTQSSLICFTTWSMFHAQRPRQGNAEGVHARRFCVCHPHRGRRSLCRLEGQRQDCAAEAPIEQRGCSRDLDRSNTGSPQGLAEICSHVAGQDEDQTLAQERRAKAQRGNRPPLVGARISPP
jgi:Guanosine polyphosphate pyrophosphohydrolases/synthetases